MKINKALLLSAALSLLTISCGGGGSSKPKPPVGAPIDPSGNWTMTATDGGGKSIDLAALFAQTGAVVTANSFTAAGTTGPFSCTPFSATLSNGLVQNISNFTGTVTFGGNFGAFTFDTTLTPDGKSFTGTYSNMPSCTGLLLSGTFTGAEVPTTTGSWTGTIQPCQYSQQTGVCTLSGTTSPITASLTQDDVSGNVTGTFQVTSVPGFSQGTVAVTPPFDILSGRFWQFSLTDNSGSIATVCGGCTPGANGTGTSGLDLNRNFTGLVSVHPVSPTSNYYWITVSH